jgi:hypothetical protein
LPTQHIPSDSRRQKYAELLLKIGLLQGEHGADDTDGGKCSKLHAHASSATLGGGAARSAASSAGGAGACVTGRGRTCSACSGEHCAIVRVGGVDTVAASARGCARDASCEGGSTGDCVGRCCGVAGRSGQHTRRRRGLGARAAGSGGRGRRVGRATGCECCVSGARTKVDLERVGAKHTDGLASVLAGLLEPLGSSVFVVAAVLGDVAGHLIGLVGADVLDVGRVLAGAARLLVRDRKCVSCCATGASYLTAARRHAGGAAAATRAARARTARRVEAFANMMSGLL